MTAAMGIPKLEAGPQKSAPLGISVSHCPCVYSLCPSRIRSSSLVRSMRLSIHLQRAWAYPSSSSIGERELTGRAEVVRDRVGPDLRVERLDSCGHFVDCL